MSKRLAKTAYVSGVALILACCATVASQAQVVKGGPIVVGGNSTSYAPGTIYDPPSSVPLATDVGRRVHTHLKIMVPPVKNGVKAAPPNLGRVSPLTVPYGGYFYETPASLACLYGTAGTVLGCNPNTVTANGAGGSKAIAIVDAYDYPTAAADLATFSSQMGLPSATFSVVYATGTKPPTAVGTGWDTEEALDIQYAHGMAPKATIYLVEAMSSNNTDMFAAVAKASTLVAAAGGGEVSMSWGSGEYSSETSLDSSFTTAKVVYFASAGDSPGTEYPCVSPNVVCVGGTGNARNPNSGLFEGTVAWTDTGGGISAYELRPTFQNSIFSIVGAYRGAPDIAAVADPNTGVWVYNSGAGGWLVVGGTSVASPVVAGLVNSAGHFYASSKTENYVIYQTLGVPNSGWNDVTSGWCNHYDGFLANQGWDLCTGIGSPFLTSNK